MKRAVVGWVGNYWERMNIFPKLAIESYRCFNPEDKIVVYTDTVQQDFLEYAQQLDLEIVKISVNETEERKHYLDYIRMYALSQEKEPFIWFDPDTISYSNFNLEDYPDPITFYWDERDSHMYDILHYYKGIGSIRPYLEYSQRGANMGIVMVRDVETANRLGEKMLKIYSDICNKDSIWSFYLNHFVSQRIPLHILEEELGKSWGTLGNSLEEICTKKVHHLCFSKIGVFQGRGDKNAWYAYERLLELLHQGKKISFTIFSTLIVESQKKSKKASLI